MPDVKEYVQSVPLNFTRKTQMRTSESNQWSISKLNDLITELFIHDPVSLLCFHPEHICHIQASLAVRVDLIMLDALLA